MLQLKMSDLDQTSTPDILNDESSVLDHSASASPKMMLDKMSYI